MVRCRASSFRDLQQRLVISQGTNGLWYKTVDEEQSVKLRDLSKEQQTVYQVRCACRWLVATVVMGIHELL